MTSKSPEFSQLHRSTRLQPLRRRSRSAAVIQSGINHDVESDPDHVGSDDVDADFDWDRRRQSANSVPSFRFSTWLQQRLTFGRAPPVADGRARRTSTAPNVDHNDRPHMSYGGCCAGAVTASSADVLDVSPGHDCKCVSCPELADPVSSASAPVNERPPRHQAVRKTCSDTGFKPTAVVTDTETPDKQLLLSVPAVFVTSYTRSVEAPHVTDQRAQPPPRRQAASLARKRLISMSDSRLGDHFATISPTPPSAASIWKLTEFLCIGNAAAAINDRLLCFHSVLGLVDLCVVEAVPRGDAERWAPCSCGDQRRHRRSTLRLSVSRTDLDDIRSCFPTINRFVDGFRRRRREAWSSRSPPTGRVMIYCETGDTLSVLAAAQYLVTVERQTLDDVERCLSKAGCVTPLTQPFAAVLRSVYD